MNTVSEFSQIERLDLDPIKVKLMHAPSGQGWSRAKADAVAAEYRRFLMLIKLYPLETTAPLEDVDTFWHYHILDTMKYASDCNAVFGHFLHHYPYVGLAGASDTDDAAMHEQAAQRMRVLYLRTFGEAGPTPYAETATAATAAAPVVVAGPVHAWSVWVEDAAGLARLPARPTLARIG